MIPYQTPNPTYPLRNLIFQNLCGVPVIFRHIIAALVRTLRCRLIYGHPRSALRFLCVASLCAVYQLRVGKPVTQNGLTTLAATVDLGASINRHFDHKGFEREQCVKNCRLLRKLGQTDLWRDYIWLIRQSEQNRPNCQLGSFEEIHRYREQIARVSLGVLVTASGWTDTVQGGIRSLDREPLLNKLFHLVMLIQALDDILDYHADRLLNLPSLLHCCKPVNQVLAELKHKVEHHKLAGCGSSQSTRSNHHYDWAMQQIIKFFTLLLALIANGLLSDWVWPDTQTSLNLKSFER